MRLDPAVAQELADAARAVLGAVESSIRSMPTPQERARLRRALDAARLNDETNRVWVDAHLVAGGERLPSAHEVEAHHLVLPLRDGGAYGS